MAKYKVTLSATVMVPKEKKRQYVISAPDAETAQKEAIFKYRDSLIKDGFVHKDNHISVESVNKKAD